MTVVDVIKPDKRHICRCYFCGSGDSVEYLAEPDEIPAYAPQVYACKSCVISFLSDDEDIT